jgi:GTP cyclohydrolase II
MLASAATTPSLTSSVVTRSRSTGSHYNKRDLNTNHENTSAPATFQLEKVAEAEFPTRYGRFRIFGFAGHAADRVEEAVVLRMGDLAGDPAPLVRIHSECLTGDVFHSLRCDCRAQLELSLGLIAEEGRGLLIYEHQEGRGIGLLNKLRAYELQDQGADTVEANQRLGFQIDLRNYDLPGAILRYFGLKQVRLISNNPEKVEAVERAGVAVSERIPCLIEALDTTEAYLRTKKNKMGHFIEGL